MNYTKVILFLLITFSFYGCSLQTYNLKDNQLHFNNKDKKVLIVDISEDKKVTQFDKCTIDAYTINTTDEEFGDLFIEDIALKSNCDWEGLGRGQFTYFFKRNMKIKDMKLLKRVDIGNYEFSQYLLDNRCTVNIIYIWGSARSTFILDKSGKLSNTLLKRLGAKEEFGMAENICNIKYEKSMVKVNWFEKFFHKEVRGDDPSMIFPIK